MADGINLAFKGLNAELNPICLCCYI